MPKPSSSKDPVAEALSQFKAAIPSGVLKSETLPLLEVLGRVLSDDLKAVIDDPPYNRSIMEGFVAHVADLSEATETTPVSLEIAGEIAVGDAEAGALVPGKVMAVTTGSFIPNLKVGVVRAWDVKVEGQQMVASKALRENDCIEMQGEIRKSGTVLLEKGHKLCSEDLFLLASQGLLEVAVVRRPRVALFSSGNEVIAPSEAYRVGAIWDCNQYGLTGMIEEAGGVAEFKGIMKDDFDIFLAELKKAVTDADMVVISGGTAVGGKDFTASLIDATGAPGVLVNGIPMRSGKPIVLGVVDGTPIVCVAGHPPEAVRGFSLFAAPAIAHMTGKQN